MFVEVFWRDLRHAARTLRQNPAFAAAGVITLALGIGANTAVFTVIRAVLLKPLEFQDPDRLLFLSVDNPKRTLQTSGPFSLEEFESMQAGAQSLTKVGAYGANPENISLSEGRGEPEALKAARVSANFLEVLGIQPLLGRSFRPEEDQRGGPDVAMISSELWKRRFSSDPAVAGKIATLNAKLYTIVGVLPPGFEFPFSDVDVWLPRPSEWSALPPRFWGIPLLDGFARIKAGVTLEQAQAEMRILHSQYVQSHPSLFADKDAVMKVVWLKDRLVADVRTTLWMLLGAVTFVLLIACGNVAGLLLAKALARSHELAVRAALGAARLRLISQLLAESLLLSLIGGGVGLLVARWALEGIQHLGSFARSSGNALFLPGSGEIRLDGMVLVFAFVLSVATGIVFGLLPSIQASRPGLADVLKERGEGRAWLAGRRPLGWNVRSLLLAGQVALSVVLLIGAALFMESVARLRSVNPGFRTENILSLKIALPGTRYDTDQKRWTFFDQLLRRVQALPGVNAAGVALSLPTTTNNLGTNVDVEGQPHLEPARQPIAQLQSVTPEYFRAMGIPLVRGREFTARDDRPGAPPVVLINESFARRYWPDYPAGLDPVGRHIGEGADRLHTAEIIGIVGNVHERALAVDPAPEFYVPSGVHPPQTAYLVVRTYGTPLSVAAAIRGEVLAIDRDQAISDVRTMETVLDLAMGQRHLTMALLGVFAVLAVLLSLVGIYGITAYSVTQRTHEIGIRRALGAGKPDILRLVLGQSLTIALAGVAVGIAGAFALTRILKEFLFQVSTTDPPVFAGMAALFIGVALLASLIPAWRAARVDPMDALRGAPPF
jgi:predicted permease